MRMVPGMQCVYVSANNRPLRSRHRGGQPLCVLCVSALNTRHEQNIYSMGGMPTVL